MAIWQEILFGIIQGIAEPIPVSSSAQTMIASDLMGVKTPGILFEVFLNFASFLAILWLTRKEVVRIVKGFILFILHRKEQHSNEFRMALFVVVGTLPAMLFGFTMKDIIDVYFSDNMTFIGIALIVTGAFLYFVRKINGTRGEIQMTWKDALVIGLVQGTLSLIPGISRSGSTIVAALFLGLNRKVSFEYSFLLYLPIGLGAMLLGAKELFQDPLFLANKGGYAIMFIVTFFMTMVGFKLFKNIMEKGKLIYFSIYCWILGLALAIVDYLELL